MHTERTAMALAESGARFLLATLAVGAMLVTASGCSDKKKKATKVLKQAVEKCRKSDETFHTVRLMKGSDEQNVLAQTCTEKLEKIELVDEFSAEARVGPYLWRAGLDDATGLWTMQSVQWDDLNQARKHLDSEDPGKNILQHAEKRLGKAQKTYPKSSWIRLKRLETRLRIRTLDRDSAESGLDLGKPVRNQLEATIDWGEKKEDRETVARARLQAIDYHLGFRRQIEDALGAMGSQDVHLKRSAKLAEDRGNDKKAEQYRKELEQLKEKRPEERKRYNALLDRSRTILCDRFAELSTEGIDDEELTKQIDRTKDRFDCSKDGDDSDAKGTNDGGK